LRKFLIDLAIKPFFCLIGFLLFSLLGVVSGVIGNGGVIGGIGRQVSTTGDLEKNNVFDQVFNEHQFDNDDETGISSDKGESTTDTTNTYRYFF
jgi:hypothetical protein